MNMKGLLLVVLAILAARTEAQFCFPGSTVQIFVGDTATDAYCHYNDIQSALNAVGSCPTQINITRMHIWNNQHLNTGGKRVTLQGWGDGETCFTVSQKCGPEICSIPTSTQPLVTINANDTPGRVLMINGSSSVVTLRHLFIMRGSEPSGDGGGIGFSGTGSLTLDTTTVSLNNAEYGGGINFRGTGTTRTQAVLRLRKESLILNNTAAVSGGGIRVEGQAQLLVEEPRTWIALNTALTGFGGGVELIGPAEGHIGSPGYNGAAVISSNEAQDGGGIAVVAGDGSGLSADLHLYSIDPQEPVAVSGNAAGARGGALYVHPYIDEVPSFTNANATVWIYGARLDDNTAPDGAIAYLDSDIGGLGGAWGSQLFIEDVPSPRGGHGCPETPPCTRMSGNATRTLNGVPVPNGALIAMRRATNMPSNRVEFRGNEAGYLLHVEPDDRDFAATSPSLQNCLVADNAFANGVLRAEGGGYWSMRITGCTFAGNAIAAGPVVYARDGELLLEYSIIDQPGVATLDQAGISNSPFAQYLLSNDVSTLPAAVDILQGVPDYVDGLNGNYRLKHNSLGIDLAPGLAAPGELELDGMPRIYDIAGISNHFGPRDLGAYERNDEPPVELIFRDGFETVISSQ